MLNQIKCRSLSKMAVNETGPEKAGVGGSIPSLATTFNNLQTTKSVRLAEHQAAVVCFSAIRMPVVQAITTSNRSL